jgi:lactate dehydrogenase-like 2-hydroxyacid dehydrogenase
VDLLMAVQLPALARRELEKVFTVHSLHTAPEPEALLRELQPSLRAIATGAAILAESPHVQIDSAFMARFPKLEIVANLGVGYDNIDAVFAASKGILVTNTPDVLTDETADTAMGLLINTVRELPAAERYLRAGKWRSGPFRLTASLRDRTMGIIGLGRIGKAIARRAEPFGVKIVYHGRNRQPGVAYPYFASLVEMAAAVDILMVVTPGGPETRNLVGDAVLEALGPEGFLINIARGSVVDEPALIRALQAGRIAGAGLDVFASEPDVPEELVSMENVVLLPHVGSGSRHTRDMMNRLIAENLKSWAAGRGPLTPVPETPWLRPEKQG